MNDQEIRAAIEQELKDRKKEVLNKNAIGAFFSAFSNPVSSLGKIFLGREDALDTERAKIVQDKCIELLCKIDDAISELDNSAISIGVKNIVTGTIETHASGSDEVIGVHIKGGGGTELKPGTHIKTTSTATKKVTGLKIEN